MQFSSTAAGVKAWFNIFLFVQKGKGHINKHCCNCLRINPAQLQKVNRMGFYKGKGEWDILVGGWGGGIYDILQLHADKIKLDKKHCLTSTFQRVIYWKFVMCKLF